MVSKTLLFLLFLLNTALIFSQTPDSTNNYFTNSADNLITNNSKLTIGGYGEIHFNQAFDAETRNNGKLDVHRLVMLFGYKFNDRTQFVSEIEYEHVKEVYIEQAFIQYKINSTINFRAGLLLVPMGIINEYHEPTTFNGVERPLLDKTIAPTTWREIGFGFNGTYLPASLKYQAYIINGFNGYDGSAKLSGKNGLRKGRQKGAESYLSSPNFTGKLEYFGVRGLNLGLSGYFGKTQSTLYDGINKDDETAMAMADSSVVGISMFGLDARYTIKGLQLRGQYYVVNLSNTDQYNTFASSDLGNSMGGYYAEAAYNIFRGVDNIDSELNLFARIEALNTHKSVDAKLTKNEGYEKNIITTGLTLKITPGSVIKTDIQFIKTGGTDEYVKTFNAGVGVMF